VVSGPGRGTKLSYPDAEAECERRNRKLASVHGMAENAYIASMHHRDEAGLYEGLWVGIGVISDCHFSVQLNHFIPVFLSYSVAVFLK
jgi:hypothetical protein